MQEHRNPATARELPLDNEALQRIDACLDRGELDQAQLLLRDLEMLPEHEVGATYLATRLLYLRDRLPAAAVVDRLRELLLLGPFPQAEALLVLAEAGCTGRELLAAPVSERGDERISDRPTFVPDGPLYERTQRPTAPSPAPLSAPTSKPAPLSAPTSKPAPLSAPTSKPAPLSAPTSKPAASTRDAPDPRPSSPNAPLRQNTGPGSSPTIQVRYTSPPTGLTQPPAEVAPSERSGALREASGPPSGPWSRPRSTRAGRYSLTPNSVERLSPTPQAVGDARADTFSGPPSSASPSPTSKAVLPAAATVPAAALSSIPPQRDSRGVYELLEPTEENTLSAPEALAPRPQLPRVDLLAPPEQPAARHPPERPFRVPRPPQLDQTEPPSAPLHLALHEDAVERKLRAGQARDAQLRVRLLAEQALEPLTAPLGPETLSAWAEVAADWLTRCPVLHYFGPYDRSLRSLTRLDLALLTLIPTPPAVIGSAATSLLSAYVAETLRVTHHGKAEADDTTALRIVTLGHAFDPHALVQQQLARNDTLLLLERLRAELAKPRTVAWSISVPLPSAPAQLWDEPLDTEQLTALGSELRHSLWSIACARRWGQALDGSLASVSALQALLEALIPQVHTDAANEPWCKRVITLGAAYIGQVLTQQSGGGWLEREEQPLVQRFVFQLPGARLASPFAKIAAALQPAGSLRLHTAIEGWLDAARTAPRDAGANAD